MAYLPLYVMEHDRLVEKHAWRLGLGDVKVTWRLIDGGNVINDAMLVGELDIASVVAPGFLTLRSRSKGHARLEVVGLGAMSSTSMYLNARNPAIMSLRDFTDKDRIALPGVMTCLAALILQMAVAQEFGPKNYAKLDHRTIGMPYPEAAAVMLSGETKSIAMSPRRRSPMSNLTTRHPPALQLGRLSRPGDHDHGL